MSLERFGTEYGGFYYPRSLPSLDSHSIVYCIGVGEDISHDVQLAGALGCKVHLFDPTPRAISHVKMMKELLLGEAVPPSERYGGGAKNYLGLIKGSRCKASQIEIHGFGIGSREGEFEFFPPSNPNYVSFSLRKDMTSGCNPIRVPIRTLKGTMEQLGHEKIDLLKMDIEGVEVDVIEQMLSQGILPIYLSVDFDSIHKERPRVNKCIERLGGSGYQVLKTTGQDVSFIRRLPVRIGKCPWDREAISSHLAPFLKLYSQRPIRDNDGGMLSPHSFALYCMLKALRPSLVIESGIWRGHSTWLIEEASPTAKVTAIDPHLQKRDYVSPRVSYTTTDWSRLDIDPAGTVCFFDDHQDALQRLRHAFEKGYRHLIFEDNYPIGQGDCRSLKKCLERGDQDAAYARSMIDIYWEFPPPFAPVTTRWGGPWWLYPSEPPLFSRATFPEMKVLEAEAATGYTYMCYVRVRDRKCHERQA